MRVAILGGGGFRVPLLHRALVTSGLDVDEIVLQDVCPARLDVMTAVLRGDGPAVRTTAELDAALDGADLVFSAIRVGGLAGRVRDERTALDLGVLGQETVGAGGLSYAMRAVPVARHIAMRTADLAPHAWTISMTNPAGVVTEVMAEALGGRVIGVCDSPIALIRRACAAIGVDPGLSPGTLTERVAVDYLGLNHLGWLRALRVDGTDVLPRLLVDSALLQRIEEGRLFGADLIQALGALPNEYLYWYYAAEEALHGVRSAGRTRGEHVLTQQEVFYAAAAVDPANAGALWAAANDERNRSYLAELRAGERDEQDVAAGGYETIAVALAGALTGAAPATLVLNVRNDTAVAGLPADAVIEIACRVDRSGATPLPVGEPTTHQLGLMSLVKSCERAAIEAALTGSVQAALRAFALHPLVGSLDAARALARAAMDARGQAQPP
ncbi:MAG: 6-phospho-beta-glucosidase [Jatrophihabitantaceae bacterium]